MSCRTLLRPGSPHLLLHCALITICPYRLLCQVEGAEGSSVQKPPPNNAVWACCFGPLQVLSHDEVQKAAANREC